MHAVREFSLLIMAVKQKCLNLNMNLKVMCLYEGGSLTEGEAGIQYGFILILFTILKNKCIT
jgi:hypothetical protein